MQAVVQSHTRTQDYTSSETSSTPHEHQTHIVDAGLSDAEIGNVMKRRN